jgi:hypothetical protein
VVDFREKVTSELMMSAWDALALHHARGALIAVDAALDLVDTAVAVAEDRAELVDEWVRGGQLSRPTADAVRSFEANPDQQFRFVIIQPFVFFQPSLPAATA